LLCGVVFGFALAWSRVTDPAVIRDMLLLREADVFLLMGSAIAVAAIGARLLRGAGARSLVTREAVGWTTLQVHPRHIAGSAIFGTGWGIAATCPGPVTAMIGQGRLGGLLVAAGIAAGILLHRFTVGRRATESGPVDRSAAACV
jgi:uncharacterized membrane protein YedE/YeeE